MKIMNEDEKRVEKKRVYFALFFPAIISFIIVVVFLFERGMGLEFGFLGVFPRDTSTLWHILSMPFVHSDWSHLFNNVISFLVLGTCLYYFYGEIASRVLVVALLVSGVLLWIIGREAWHIGLSGVIYALSFFLFFSGILRKYIPLVAISFIVVFLYGSNVWHLFPWEENGSISWEGHLAGAISGLLLSFIYRKKGPQKPIVIWTDEEDMELDDENAYWKDNNNNETDVM